MKDPVATIKDYLDDIATQNLSLAIAELERREKIMSAIEIMARRDQPHEFQAGDDIYDVLERALEWP